MPLRHFAILAASLVALWAPPFAKAQDAVGPPPGTAGVVSEEHANNALSAFQFTFFHELAHALISELALNTPGPEEDVADEMAIFTMLGAGEEGGFDVLVRAALSHLLLWERDQNAQRQIPWEDEHDMDIQRFYTIHCLLYGSNPGRFWPQVVAAKMSVPRARKCEAEYQRKQVVWEKVLGEHRLHPGEQSPGQVTVHYVPPELEFGRTVEPILRESGLLDAFAAYVDGTYRLPSDIALYVQECGEPNAFWSGEHREIILCYELLQTYVQLFAPLHTTEEQQQTQPPPTQPPSTKAQDALPFVQGALTLIPGEYRYWPFQIVQRPARVFGRCSAYSIAVYLRIVDQTQLENFKLMGHDEKYQFQTICGGGLETVDITLAPGQYFVLISNRDSRNQYIEVDIRGVSR